MSRYPTSLCPTWLAPWLLAAALGCGHTPVQRESLAAPAPRTSTAESPPPSPCWNNGRPAAAAPAAPHADDGDDDESACATLFAHQVERMQKLVRKRFDIREKPSLLVIDFGCDKAGDALHTIALEHGEGHGGSMQLTWIEVEGDWAEVRRLTSQRDRPLRVQHTRIELADLVPVMDEARTALVVKPHYLRLAHPRNSMRGAYRSTLFSSRDFHLAVRVTDAEQRSTAREFSGYDSSNAQERSLPMKLAVAPLEQLLEAQHWTTTALQDEDRQRFTTRLQELMVSSPAWWVREHFLQLATELATVDALPALAHSLAGLDDQKEPRARTATLDALTAISGWDPRRDAQGNTLDAQAASAVAMRSCTP